MLSAARCLPARCLQHAVRRTLPAARCAPPPQCLGESLRTGVLDYSSLVAVQAQADS
jgi:hypothetical protein